MIKLENLLGRFRGTVVRVVRTQDRTQLNQSVDMPGRFKGYNEEGLAFNRSYIPPVYSVTLQNKKGRKREFNISTDNPPEVGTKIVYRIKRIRNGTLYY